jgi:hypothetical protein
MYSLTGEVIMSLTKESSQLLDDQEAVMCSSVHGSVIMKKVYFL